MKEDDRTLESLGIQEGSKLACSIQYSGAPSGPYFYQWVKEIRVNGTAIEYPRCPEADAEREIGTKYPR